MKPRAANALTYHSLMAELTGFKGITAIMNYVHWFITTVICFIKKKKVDAMSWKKSSLSGALKLNNHYATSKKGPLWFSNRHPQCLQAGPGWLAQCGIREPRETSLRRAQAVALITNCSLLPLNMLQLYIILICQCKVLEEQTMALLRTDINLGKRQDSFISNLWNSFLFEYSIKFAQKISYNCPLGNPEALSEI